MNLPLDNANPGSKTISEGQYAFKKIEPSNHYDMYGSMSMDEDDLVDPARSSTSVSSFLKSWFGKEKTNILEAGNG